MLKSLLLADKLSFVRALVVSDEAKEVNSEFQDNRIQEERNYTRYPHFLDFEADTQRYHGNAPEEKEVVEEPKQIQMHVYYILPV